MIVSNDSIFWSLIEDAKSNAQNNICEYLMGKLDSLSVEDIYKFDITFINKMNALCTLKTLSALVIIDSWAGDECFDDFRSWIISQGKIFFEQFITDPDELTDILFIESDKRGYAPRRQCLQRIGTRVIYQKMGNDDFAKTDFYKTHISNRSYGDAISDLNAPHFTDKQLKTTFPKLWAAFNPS